LDDCSGSVWKYKNNYINARVSDSKRRKKFYYIYLMPNSNSAIGRGYGSARIRYHHPRTQSAVTEKNLKSVPLEHFILA